MLPKSYQTKFILLLLVMTRVTIATVVRRWYRIWYTKYVLYTLHLQMFTITYVSFSFCFFTVVQPDGWSHWWARGTIKWFMEIHVRLNSLYIRIYLQTIKWINWFSCRLMILQKFNFLTSHGKPNSILMDCEWKLYALISYVYYFSISWDDVYIVTLFMFVA